MSKSGHKILDLRRPRTVESGPSGDVLVDQDPSQLFRDQQVDELCFVKPVSNRILWPILIFPKDHTLILPFV